MFGAHPMFRIGGGQGYQITNSLRFRASNSAYIRRTIGASSTSTTVATWSFWIKRGAFAAARQVIVYNGNTAGTGNTIQLEFTSGSAILAYFNGAGTTGFTTNAVFRDPSAWYHVVLAYDSTQATDSNRAKLYVNGTQITSFSSVTYPALNQAFNAGSGDYQQMMGFGATLNADGYMANVYFIDGQALTPSSFGQTDATTGVWVPKSYSGTYGTNGFFLEFKDASSTTTIGYDTSGNSNNFTTSGISVTSGVTFDQMTDTPTNNYSVMNPISVQGVYSSMTEANMAVSLGAAAARGAVGSIFVATGKWYWEVVAAGAAAIDQIGIISTAGTFNGGVINEGVIYWADGKKAIDGTSSAYGATYAANDVIGVAIDCDAATIVFYKNGVSQGSISMTARTYAPAICTASGAGGPYRLNFGQRAFSYTPPSGFKALNTANLSVPTIKKPSTYFDATLRTGTGATASVSSLGFQPDLVWTKSRSNASTTTNIFDSQRGTTKGIGSTGSNAEYTDANTLTAFNSNGFTYGSDASSRGVNINTNTYVDWAWKESVGAGLDIITYAGNGGGARNIAHGLGVAPQFMLVRGTDARVWATWHKNLTSAAYYLDIGSTLVETLDTTMFDSTAPDASNFRVGSYNNVNAVNYVAYLWAGIPGYSQFGTFTGNGSTDGPFIFCNFRPALILFKNIDQAGNPWVVKDKLRANAYNPATGNLYLSGTNAEDTISTVDVDFLSNGFKPRGTYTGTNGTTYRIVYAAFAEAPFKYSRAR
jgi:hypothetical protein